MSEFETFRARFAGEWRITTSATAARQTVDRAIEETVNAMNFFLRGVARGQLQDNTPINQRITFTFLDGERVRVLFNDTNWRATSRVGRTIRTRSSDDVEMRVTQRFLPSGALEQVFATDQGTRWNTYTSTGENTMRVDAVTQGMMMPQAMRFSLEYAR